MINKLTPSYTVLGENNLFSYTRTEFINDQKEFIKRRFKKPYLFNLLTLAKFYFYSTPSLQIQIGRINPTFDFYGNGLIKINQKVL